jgi:hypothetical protein
MEPISQLMGLEVMVMWRKRKWIIVAVLAAVVVIVGGVMGGVVYAQSSSATSTPPINPGKDLADRVAAKLNLDPATVESAFAQAEKDMQNDAVKAYLDKLVQAGKMTQSDADKYLQWWQSKPETPQGLRGLPGFGGRGFGFRGGFRGFGGKGVTPVPSPSTSTQ